MIRPHPTASIHDIHPAPPTWHNGLCHNAKALQIHHNCLDRVESLVVGERGGSSTTTGWCGTEWPKMIGGRSCDCYRPTSISCRLTVAAPLTSRACRRGVARGLEEQWALQPTDRQHSSGTWGIVCVCVGIGWDFGD